MNPQLAQDAAEKLNAVAQSAFTMPPKTGYAAWKHVPSTSSQCLKDEAVPMFWQNFTVKQEENLFDVRQLDSGHSPLLSMPKETAEVIVKPNHKPRT